MLEDAKDCKKVNESFLKKCQRKENPITILQAALHVLSYSDNLDVSLRKLEALQVLAKFKVEGKCAVFHNSVNQYQDLAVILLFRVAYDYYSLKGGIEHFEEVLRV